MHPQRNFIILITLIHSILSSTAQDVPSSLGIFEGQSDVGNPARPGAVQFDEAKQTYLVTGGGSNMWFGGDAFHFVWKKVSGDVSLAADVSFVGNEGDAHRKACLIVRQDLEPGSPYADAALHGNGLAALQYRETDNAMTTSVAFSTNAPSRMRIEKHGENVSMFIAATGEKLRFVGKTRLALKEPYYVGIGLCAHDNKALRQAVFSKVELTARPVAPKSDSEKKN